MGEVGILRAIGRGIAAAAEPLIDTFSYGPGRRELAIALELEPREDVGPLPTAELEAASARLAELEDAAEIVEGISAVLVLLEQFVRAIAFHDDEDNLKEIGLRLLEIAGASRVRQRYPFTHAAARLAGVLTDDALRIDWDRAGDFVTRLLVPKPPDDGSGQSEPVPIDAVWVQAWIVLLSILLGKSFGVDEIDWLYGWDPDPTILDDPAQQISERTVTVSFREAVLESDTSSDALAAEALISSAFLGPEHGGPAVALGLGGALEIETGGEDVDPETSRPVRPPGTRFRVAAPSAATMLIPLPGSDAAFRLDGGAQGPTSVTFDLRRPPSDTKLVFPDDTRRRWEIGGIAFSGGIVANDLSFELTVSEGAIVIDPKPDPGKPAEPGSELLDGPTRLPFSFSVGWTASRGLFISGGTPFGFTVPTPWLKLFGLRFQHVRLELVPPGGEVGRAVGVDATTTATLDIGKYFHAIVDRIGVRLLLDFNGDADFKADFIAPDGIGLRGDYKMIKGGGMLVLDRDRGEYAGAFEVTVALKKFELKLQAVVLYSTKLEGVDRALLASLSAQGFRLNLGWGFALTGVGGMIGVNFGYDLAALRDGLRTGVLDLVMFPDDPVRNAPRIFQTLRTVFPKEPEATTAALFFELKWLDDLARVRLGALTRWRPGADDGELVLLGSVDVALPTRPHDVLRVQADILGVINWTDGLAISVDAHLRDSHLLGIALTGSLALRYRRGGAEPMFLLSIGGFHPQFPLPPANVVPRLDRVGFRLEKSNLRLSAEIYFAIAAATIQFGLRADLVARGLGLRFEATFALDVIVETGTGHYVADLQVRAALKRGSTTLMGVDFHGRLEGTSPSRFSGKVTFKIWFIKKSISVNEPLAEGEVQQALVDALPLLVAELSHPRNWDGATPGEGRRLISTDPVTDGADAVVVVHPLAELGVRQQVLPLKLELDRIGSARPAGERRFAITRLSGLGDDVELEDVTDHFAAAQFLDLDEAAALSQPGFERMPAGVRARSDAAAAGTGRRRLVVYETIVIPEDHRPVPTPPRGPRGLVDVFAEFSAVASTQRAVGGAEESFPPAPGRRVDVRPDGYVLVTGDLAPAGAPAQRSFHLARQALARDGDATAVVEAHEVRG